jgi:hypothetical protein
MRLCVTAVLLFIAELTGSAQNAQNWDSLGTLHPGDKVRVSLKASAPVNGDFQNFTPQQVRVGAVTAPKQDVIRVDRYTNKGGRSKRAAIGALIGFGGGFAIGAAVGGCRDHPAQGFVPSCIGSRGRGEAGAVVGGAGALVGAAVGALLPHRSKELIYSAP